MLWGWLDRNGSPAPSLFVICSRIRLSVLLIRQIFLRPSCTLHLASTRLIMRMNICTTSSSYIRQRTDLAPPIVTAPSHAAHARTRTTAAVQGQLPRQWRPLHLHRQPPDVSRSRSSLLTLRRDPMLYRSRLRLGCIRWYIPHSRRTDRFYQRPPELPPSFQSSSCTWRTHAHPARTGRSAVSCSRG